MEDLKLAPAKSHVEIHNSELLQVGIGLKAKRRFAKDEEIFVVEGQKIDYRTLRTLQLNEKTHIDPVNEFGEPQLGYYLNHSCSPNAYPLIEFDDNSNDVMKIYALHTINKGDEITVDYAFMESEVANGCPCKCGSQKCRGAIVGFKDLKESEIESYLKQAPISDHLFKLLKIVQ